LAPSGLLLRFPVDAGLGLTRISPEQIDVRITVPRPGDEWGETVQAVVGPPAAPAAGGRTPPGRERSPSGDGRPRRRPSPRRGRPADRGVAPRARADRPACRRTRTDPRSSPAHRRTAQLPDRDERLRRGPLRDRRPERAGAGGPRGGPVCRRSTGLRARAGPL